MDSSDQISLKDFSVLSSVYQIIQRVRDDEDIANNITKLVQNLENLKKYILNAHIMDNPICELEEELFLSNHELFRKQKLIDKLKTDFNNFREEKNVSQNVDFLSQDRN
ncbi:hypothetical protein A3Q56_07402 [Intoshia linei]|uniref:Uncharacterized protein n=1 Tax=Intoshia linei TaxID=1819745 RepID=A0A177ASC8_9BILA|nr:hypothetical protein A3Q56_07402 [Intoshia linei]